jgi:hypothetical protein
LSALTAADPHAFSSRHVDRRSSEPLELHDRPIPESTGVVIRICCAP